MNSIFDRWAPRLVCGLAAVVPLLFVFDLYDAFDLRSQLAALYLTVIVLLLLWSLQTAGSEKWWCRWRRTPLDLPGFSVFSVFSGLSPPLIPWSPH